MPAVSRVIASSSSSSGVSVPLLVAAAAVAIAWLVLAVLIVLIRRPPHVHPAATGIDLPPEPPAVAGLLVSGFVVPAETAPAILLDLAARKVVDLDEVQPGRTICRIHARTDQALSDYEQRVLTAVRAKAIDGVVPTDALTTGTDDQSAAWHRALAREVIADAHTRNLTRDRWPGALVGALTVGLLPIGGLLYLALRVGGDVGGDRVVLAALAGAVAVGGLMVGFGLVGRLGRSIAQLPTAEGRVAASRVAGLAVQLRHDAMLADLPPASVIVRGRQLAYAAAFGAAPHAVALLPMGAEDDHRAWSRFGGQWRRVRVRYPRAFPPAWGKHPGIALLLAVIWGAVAGAVVWGLTLLDDASRPAEVSRSAWEWVGRAASLALIPTVLVAGWVCWVLARAVPDLWSRRTVTGEIVRHRRFRQWFARNDPKYWYYLALDDGSDHRVAAWRVRDVLWRAHEQGESVTAEITPRLRYVRTVTRSAAPGVGSGAA